MSVDQRFYKRQCTIGLQATASTFGLTAGDFPDVEIAGISSFANAGDYELCYLEALRQSSRTVVQSAKKVCFLPSADPAIAALPDIIRVPVTAPKEAFFQIARQMYAPLLHDEGAGDAQVHPSARIGSGAIISKGAAVGENTIIGSHVYIGPGVQIGRDCHIGAHVSLEFCLVGNTVRILSGARIGQTGFGLMNTDNGAEEIPHFGRVILQDRVYIGANTCVDRGLLDDTVVGEGSKIDNMSHIGHNTCIGRNVVMAAYAGISGSVHIGDGVQMGGRVGVVDHVEIGAGSQIAAGANVLTSVPAGVVWGGVPARPIKDWQRETIWLKRQAAKGRGE